MMRIKEFKRIRHQKKYQRHIFPIFENVKLNSTTSWFISITLVIIALVYGEPIIVPFIIALLIWFIVKKIRNLIDKVPFVKKYIPTWLKSILASALIFSALMFAAEILIHSIENLSLSYKSYASNIETISKRINELFNIDIQEEITSFMEDFDFSSYLKSLLNHYVIIKKD